jgi:hypothetical protein
MPCHLVVYHSDSRTRNEYVCDEENTSRVVEDDHAAKGAGEYTDVSGNQFTVDWTQSRLVGFVRKRDDGAVIASGGVDGSQSPVT